MSGPEDIAAAYQRATNWRESRRLAAAPRLITLQEGGEERSSSVHSLGREIWPDPDLSIVSPDRDAPPPFPGEAVFGPRWNEWLLDTAKATGAPPDYVAAALLAVAASLIGNARWSKPWDGWEEPAVLWLMLIGQPSANKTPSLKAASKPLNALALRLREEALEAVQTWEEEAVYAAARESEWEADVKAAAKDGKDPPPKPTDAEPSEKPVVPLLCVNDATTERLAVVLSRQHRGTLALRDELTGWLMNMSRYANGGSDKPFWLEAYNGGGYSQERQSRQTYVARLSVGVVGCIVPDKLQSVLLGVDDDGLLARFIPVWPDRAPVVRPNKAPDDVFAERAFERLYGLQMEEDEKGRVHPRLLPFTEPARALLLELMQETRALEDGEEGVLVSFVGKMRGFAVRLALVLAHLDWAAGDGVPPQEISEQHFGRAAHFVMEYALPMARRSYADAAVSEADKAARRLASLILSERITAFTVRDITNRNRQGLKKADVEAAVKRLHEADWLHSEKKASAGKGGRPSVLWHVNPKVGGVS